MAHLLRVSVISGLVICMLGSLTSLCLAQSAQRGNGGVDWIFVLDTSASMHGADGARNIFDRVKETIADFIHATHEGDSVALYTFDSDTQLRSNVRIGGEIDKRELLKIIGELQSNGSRTHTGKAIHDALARASELKDQPGSKDRTVSIVLFTDGLEDVRGIPNPVSIPSNVSLIPKDQPYMFFVSLGEQEHEKQLEDFVKSPRMGNRGQVVRDPGASRIAEVAESIRKTIEAPPNPPAPKEIKLSVEPASLNFGEVEPGQISSRQTLNVRSNTAIAASLILDDFSINGLSLAEPTAPLDVKAGQNTFRVSLKAAPSIGVGQRKIRLTLTPSGTSNVNATPVSIEANINVVHVPLWRKSIKWIALVLIVAILVIGAMSVVKGEPPWIWIREIGPDKRLEGEIEVIQPRPVRPEDEFISLTHQQSERVTLRSLIPSISTANSDAELLTVRRNGQKSIRLLRTKGVISVNGIEVTILDLYDGDIIEFDDARLRFNWIGHERPVATEEET